MKSSVYGIRESESGWSILMLAPGRHMETFATREEAEAALSDWELGIKLASDHPDIWVVGDFVAEAGIDGTQLGEVHEIDLRQYKVVREMSQAEHDSGVEQYFEEFGHYPGQ